MENPLKSAIQEQKNWNQDKDLAQKILTLDYENRRLIRTQLRTEALHNQPKNARELHEAVRTLFGISIPWTSTADGFHSPYNWFYDVFFGHAVTSVALASRGSGKTYLASILHYMLNTYKPGFSSKHAGGTKEQAGVASNYLYGFSQDKVLGSMFLGKPGKLAAYWKNGGQWSIVTGTMQGVSGQHPVMASWDEIEFWPVEAIEQTWAVPVDRNGHRRIWAAFSTRQRCLPAYTRVVTEDGPMKIGTIVNKKYAGKVRVWDDTNGCWDWRHVVQWHRNGSSTEWYKVYTKHSGLGKGCELVATGDHHVYYAPNKKKPLRDFTPNDCLVLPSWVPSKSQRQVLLGTLLGDAGMQRGSVRIEHSVKQIDYVRWWSKAFFEHVSGESHNAKRDHYLVRLPACPYTHNLEAEWYSTGEKRVPTYVWDELDERGLAVWLMDDGSYRKAGTKGGGDTWHIYCNHFNEEERWYMEAWFNNHDIKLSWQWNGTHHYAYIGGKSARKVTEMVSPWLQVSEHLGPRKGYKRWKGMDVHPGRQGAVQVPIDRIEIENSKPQGCYDIGVEGIHNYTNGSGVLVSNSFGAMNWLVDEAPERNIKLYQWTAFETMQRCPTCVAIDNAPYGTDDEREKHCVLWKACQGVRGRKSSGWVPRERVVELCKEMGGPNTNAWKTQGLCERPSSTGLVLGNFEHRYRVEEGNYTTWTYKPELPWYAVHDPAEGKKSVIYFLQTYNDCTFIFDELVQEACPDVTTAKQAFWEKCAQLELPDPEMIVVDPHKTDAVSTWKWGSVGGTGINKMYNADVPDTKNEAGGQEITNGIEFLRREICNGAMERKFFINPRYCPKAIRAIKEYHYPTNLKNEVTSDNPSKEYSDEIDPMRYWVMYKIFKLRPRNRRIIWAG